jgi:hypothetical protein
MSIFTALFGGGATSLVDGVGTAFDKLFTSDEEKLAAEAVLAKIAQQPHILQAEINKVEAAHRSIFVAGWRPYLGWGCATALLWHYMGYDIAVWVTVNWFPGAVLPEISGTETLTSLVMALLGMGGLRTVEKIRGKTK